uniref:Uncharacterized protein n=1 Tax=Arundo donax TaxID=35708 RepID=A0A0A9BCS3_ARUDO
MTSHQNHLNIHSLSIAASTIAATKLVYNHQPPHLPIYKRGRQKQIEAATRVNLAPRHNMAG